MVGPGVIGVDLDDDTLDAYRSIILPPGWTLEIESVATRGAAGKLRTVSRNHPDESWYGVLGDDTSIETMGFERDLVEAAGSWGIASGNDLWQARENVARGRMHGATVWGGELMRSVGGWAPDGFEHLYVDDVWETIGRSLGVWRTLMDVVTPHNHAWRNGETADGVTGVVNSEEMYQRDGKRFAEWCENEMVPVLDRTMEALERAQPVVFELARWIHTENEMRSNVETPALWEDMGVQVRGVYCRIARRILRWIDNNAAYSGTPRVSG